MRKNNEEKERIRFFDVAKGIAIICIIIGHMGNSEINKVVFTFHVPIFFFFTGYFTNDNKCVKDFCKNKFRTLIVPYILTSIIIIAVGTIKGWLIGDAVGGFKKWAFAALYGAGASYTTPFYIPAIGALWFLWATFWGSIFLRISLNFNKYLRMAFVAALFLAGYYSRSICWFPLSIQAGACATLFMYIGYLANIAKEAVRSVPKEVKSFWIVFAAIIWGSFIRDFQSFWFVSCDVGRGIIDIIRCLCACLVVIFISKWIDKKLRHIGSALAYFGKYSLLVLCVHIVELNFFPWWRIVGRLTAYGLPDSELLHLIIIKITKLVADLTCVYILSKSFVIKRLFGIKN